MAESPHGLGETARRLIYGSSLYALSLGAGPAPAPRLKLAAQWPGDPGEADALFQGTYYFAGEEVRAPNQPPWHPPGASPEWLQELHGFDWLRHFVAAGGDAARRQGRALIGSWLSHCGAWDPLVWRPDVAGRRLTAWLTHAAFLLGTDSGPLGRSFSESLHRQTRHLARTVALAPDGPPRFAAILGLIASGVALDDGGRRVERGLKLLARELVAQVLADGSHVSRDPSRHLLVLKDLIAIRAALAAGHHVVPASLQAAIEAMAPCLALFRLGDGGLTLANGGHEEKAAEIDLALAKADVAARPAPSAPDGGFERIESGPAILIADAGPGARHAGQRLHAGLFAIEFSHGRDRLIVNCGAPRRGGTDWARACARTAAHATLGLGDGDAFGIEPGDRGRLVLGRARDADDGRTWLELTLAPGGGRPGGVGLRRRLFLERGGGDLRGEDIIEAPGASADPIDFVARFHLHPRVKASLTGEGGVLLRAASGQGWRFRAMGAPVALDDSVYLGADGPPRRCRQITLRGTVAAAETVVKWGLARVET